MTSNHFSDNDISPNGGRATGGARRRGRTESVDSLRKSTLERSEDHVDPAVDDCDGGNGAALPKWSPAAVRLLQGVVYNDEQPAIWELILQSMSALADYFGKLGLLLVLDDADGMAYLRQHGDQGAHTGDESLPRLFRRIPLGYDATLLCVLLRDALRQFEEEDLQNERCVIVQHDLLETWSAYFPDQEDEVRLNRGLVAALRKLEELKFVRQFEQHPPSWEVRRIIKARLPLEDLERVRQSLLDALEDNLVHDAPPAA